MQQGWLQNFKPNNVANNTLKYQRVDTERRTALRAAWNEPLRWPFLILLGGILALLWPAVRAYRARADLNAFDRPAGRR